MWSHVMSTKESYVSGPNTGVSEYGDDYGNGAQALNV
jgi:hypothetical protein